MANPRPRIEIKHLGDVTIVRFPGKRLKEEKVVEAIGQQLFKLVGEIGPKKTVLDFRNVVLLSSAAIGKLLTLLKKVHAAGGRLALCNLDPATQELFAITKLDKLFQIEPPPAEDRPDADFGLRRR